MAKGISVGTACIKTRGRNAGERVEIAGFDKKTGFAEIKGKDGKKKLCNFRHLLPINEGAESKGEKKRGM